MFIVIKAKYEWNLYLFLQNFLTFKDSPRQPLKHMTRNIMGEEKYKYVTQCELMRLFEGDIKTDILNSTYCSISKEHFDTKMIFISYSYQKLQKFVLKHTSIFWEILT